MAEPGFKPRQRPALHHRILLLPPGDKDESNYACTGIFCHMYQQERQESNTSSSNVLSLLYSFFHSLIDICLTVQWILVQDFYSKSACQYNEMKFLELNSEFLKSYYRLN